MGPCSPPLPAENFNTCIEVLLAVELENTHLLCSPTLNQWGNLGPLIVKTVSTLHGDACFVRTKSCFKCILNLEFLERAVIYFCEIQVQYS